MSEDQAGMMTVRAFSTPTRIISEWEIKAGILKLFFTVVQRGWWSLDLWWVIICNREECES